MNLLRKLWPFSFETKSVSDLVLKAILYVILAALFSILMGVVSNIVVLNVIMTIVGTLADIYLLVGLILLFLSYFKVIK